MTDTNDLIVQRTLAEYTGGVFGMLEAEYAIGWGRMTLHPTLARVVDRTAQRAVGAIQHYAAASVATGVPIALLMTVVEKDRLGSVAPDDLSKHPFVDGLAGIEWTIPRCLFELERWDGWTDRAAGRRSAYLWAGVDIQATPVPVFGAAPLLRRIIELDGKLRLPLGADRPLRLPIDLGPPRRPLVQTERDGAAAVAAGPSEPLPV